MRKIFVIIISTNDINNILKAFAMCMKRQAQGGKERQQ